MKVVSPAKNCLSVQTLDGRQHNARDGIFEVPDHHGKQILAIGGGLPNQVGPTARGVGYRCTSCAFGTFTITCGRCGGECEREA